MNELEKATKNEPESKPAQDEVAKKAYAIYLKEGRPQGRDKENWLEAEANMPHGLDHDARMAGKQKMKETTVQIDGMMSIFDGAGVEKQIKGRDGVVRVDANFLSGTATIVYDETRVTTDDINRFIADCGYHCRGEVMPAHVCEPGKPRGTPAAGALERQGHAGSQSPTPTAVKPEIEKVKAAATPTPPAVEPVAEKTKAETPPTPAVVKPPEDKG